MSRQTDIKQGSTHSNKQTDIKRDYIEYGRLWKQFDEAYRKAALRMGLSTSAFEILFTLCDLGEGCLQRDVCQYACSSKQTINSSVHKLETDGIVRLEPAGTGRGMRIFLTDAGRALVDAKVAPFAEADFAVFSSLAPAEREVLMRAEKAYLEGIQKAFDAVDGAPCAKGGC